MNLLIISGHGGTPYDSGAIGNGQKEAALTRELALLVLDELRRVKGVNPILYDQRNDAYKVLENGGSLPLSGISYVLEIHFNAGAINTQSDGNISGTEVLVHSLEKGTTVEQTICRKISALGFRNRGVVRRSDLLVMNVVKKQYGISHALVETCFIDDPDDMKLYLASKPKVAKAIAQGIAEGFGLAYNDSGTGNGNGSTNTEEDDDMTSAEVQKIARAEAQAAFNALYDGENPRYTSVDQVPEYWRDEVAEMMKYGAIKGDSDKEFNLRREALQAAIIAFRAAKEMKL